mmetsp:Transcript_58774/g.190294  ORF Transcript_58774/g.190294 Transcript_58774/m.190294 type:complete len:907 (+) Transcript_58774:98-2818(+)
MMALCGKRFARRCFSRPLGSSAPIGVQLSGCKALFPQARCDASFAPAQLRMTRSREEQKRRSPSSGIPRPSLNAEVSPKRKRRSGTRAPKRRHATDLEDLDAQHRARGRSGGDDSVRAAFGHVEHEGDGGAKATVPWLRPNNIRTLVQRPVASLPRTPSFFVKFGPPLTAEDLTHDAPSILVESRKLIEDVLERRQNIQSAPDHVAPDTPFWRLPPKVLNKTGVKWKRSERDDGGTTDDISSGASIAVAQRAQEVVAQDQLQGITDLNKAKKWRMEAIAPERCASEVLDSVETAAEGDSLAPQGEVPEKVKHLRTNKRDLGFAEGLVATLRKKAEGFAKSGVDPEIKDSLLQALAHHPGTERAARLQEMYAYTKDFETLVMEGKASVANCNDLIRAQALQGKMDEAMRTHDAMQLHGYSPDDGTYVSLLLGACHLKDAELARNIFLTMRKQLISATPKVHATLIKAHVHAGDIASGYALMHKMQDEQLEPDVVVHTILINGLVSEGQLEKAWEEFHSIRTWKLIQPDEVLFTVMIKACAQASEPERAMNIFEDMRTSGLYPTDLTYGELIHAMATSADLAHKAFDFYRQMQAEDLPVTPFVFSKLLLACRRLGDTRRAQSVVSDMHANGVQFEPDMYCDLVGLLATAMRRPRVSEQEILRNLRCAWHIFGEARRRCEDDMNWTQMLNEVMGVYIAGGFSNYAVEMLQQFSAFGAKPNTQTYASLLEMLGKDLQDVGRFFALWESLPKDPKPADELYHLALEMALETRSSKRTVALLEELYAAQVFPSPQLTERLARAGRHVIQIHEMVGKLIALNKSMRVSTARRENELLQTHIDERQIELAAHGLTERSPTPAQEARTKHFEHLRKRGFYRRPWLPLGDYIASKKKGGEAYAKKHDKPRPNILAA